MARVLFIAYTGYEYDGRVKREAQALRARGDTVDVICLPSSCAGEEDGVNVVRVPIKRYRGASPGAYLFSYLKFFSRAAWIALRLHRQNPYDVVMVCTMPDAIVLCALPLKLLGAKVILDVHDTMPELYQDKFRGKLGALVGRVLLIEERLSAALADRVLAVHQPHKERLIAAGIPASKIGVVMNAADSRIFKRPPQSVAATEGRFKMVCHGTLARRLGLDIVLDAMALLRERLPDLQLEVIGSGDHINVLREKVRTLKLERQVIFRSEVAVERLPALLSTADVGLVPNLPSRATHLMLPVKLLEYVSLGIPVISARLRTIEHYFDDSSVRYFTAGSAQDLARAIEELHSRPQLRQQLAVHAKAAAALISWSIERERFYSVVDSLLNSTPGPGRGTVAETTKVKSARNTTRIMEVRWTERCLEEPSRERAYGCA
jgi:glycosyltransferase involved in cell wall biosynthesis